MPQCPVVGNSAGIRYSLGVTLPDLPTIGSRITHARTGHGWTVSELARRMPKYQRMGRDQARTHTWVLSLESNKQSPSVEQAHQLAAVLVRPAQWLIFGSASGDTEFVAAMRAIEPQLDSRGRLTVELTAQAQARMSDDGDLSAQGFGVTPQQPAPTAPAARRPRVQRSN